MISDEQIIIKQRLESQQETEKSIQRFKKLFDYLRNVESKPPQLAGLMARVYRDVDFYLSENISKFAVCKRGCSHCCRSGMPIDVSLHEAAYISQKTGFELNKKYVKHDPDDSNCPFLDTAKNECSIHEFRPLYCRAFFSMDSAKYCESNDQPHLVYAVRSNKQLQSLATYFQTSSIKTAQANNHKARGDIRGYFKK